MPLGRVRVLEDRSLRLERVVLADEGRYTCEADNPAGALEASATLTVHQVPVFTTKVSNGVDFQRLLVLFILYNGLVMVIRNTYRLLHSRL